MMIVVLAILNDSNTGSCATEEFLWDLPYSCRVNPGDFEISIWRLQTEMLFPVTR
jgi:hypothetical protein